MGFFPRKNLTMSIFQDESFFLSKRKVAPGPKKKASEIFLLQKSYLQTKGDLFSNHF